MESTIEKVANTIDHAIVSSGAKDGSPAAWAALTMWHIALEEYLRLVFGWIPPQCERVKDPSTPGFDYIKAREWLESTGLFLEDAQGLHAYLNVYVTVRDQESAS